MTLREAFERDGFIVVDDVIGAEDRDAALEVFDELEGRAGRRDALAHAAIAALAAAAGVTRLARQLVGADAICHRAILFGKTPDTNWLVRWHQDTVIAVNERHDAPGWTAWSEKDGQPCARPPRSVLEARAALRIDLDGSGASNGGLRVVPGSHRGGVLEPEAMRTRREQLGESTPNVKPCGALVLRPLLLHASSRSTGDRPRRVVHLEFGSPLEVQSAT